MGAWQTQTIIYKHGHLSFMTIEYQMQDVGALGYKQRTVEVTYITPWFMITEERDLTKKISGPWFKIDKEVNELGIK
jgi:hypothetical protein